LIAVRFALVSLLLCVAVAAGAQTPVGNIHLKEGTAQLARQGTWSDIEPGTEVFEGDSLRTGASSKLQVLFRDASMLTLGENSVVAVDRQLFDPPKGVFDSSFRLLVGKVRALTSDYYRRPGSYFEVETLTATTGVRGTDFIVTYDDRNKVTEAIGISGTISVHSVLDRARKGVLVTEGEVTTVREGFYPTPPRRLDGGEFRQYLEGFTMTTAGSAESLSADSALASGDSVPEQDTAPAVIEAAGLGETAVTAEGPQTALGQAPQNPFEDPTNTNSPEGTTPAESRESTRARVDF
jgi:hypothetical protein